MKRSCLVVMSVLRMGCTFGGGEGISLDPAEDGDIGSGDGSGERDDDASPAGAIDAGRASVDAAVSSLDVPVTAARDAALSGASCEAPPDLPCDPVKGQGCLPFTQCIATSASDGPAAGCVLSGLRFDDACTQDAFSTNCPAQHGCVEGACLKYCYCDADCGSGACVAASGSAFKVCR